MYYILGHCGSFGIGGVITVISVGQLMFTLSCAGVILSFYSTAGTIAPLASPFIFDAMGPVMWLSGIATAAMGFLLLSSPNSKTRPALMNIWLVLIVFHTVIIFTYGIHMVLRMRDLYLIHKDIYTIIGEKLVEKLKPNQKVAQKMSEGGLFLDLIETASAGLVLAKAPYPFNFLFLMGLRSDIAATFFVILPGVFSIFSIPFAVAIRNYFASDRASVSRHREVYNDRPLSGFICSGLAGKEDDPDAHDDEEDLASTFDGSSQDESGDEDEEDSLMSSRSSQESIHYRTGARSRRVN